MRLRGWLAVALCGLVTVLEAPVLHAHRAQEPALYDEECPTARLATGASNPGLGPRPLPAVGGPMPVDRAPDILPSPETPGHSLGATEARSPPLSA